MPIPNPSRSDIRARLLEFFPQPWTGDVAKQVGGLLYTILDAWATNHGFISSEIQYASKLTRIDTAVGPGLDAVALDYFGSSFLRQLNESDTSFRARIKQYLLLPRVTRQAIFNAVVLFTGQIPIITEPWNPGDTCSYDNVSYYDVDLPPNNPCRWGDDGLPYQGMVTLDAPIFSVTGGQPVLGYDAGDAYDQGYAAYFDFTPMASPQFAQQVDTLLSQFKLEGTIAWRKYYLRGASQALMNIVFAAGSFEQQFNNSNLIFFYLHMLNEAGKFILICETPPWSTQLWIRNQAINFTVDSSVPAPVQSSIGVYGLPVSTPGVLKVPVNAKQFNVTIDAFQGFPFISPSWNVTPWVSSLTSSRLTIGLSGPGPGILDVLFLPDAAFEVNEGVTSVTISGPFVQPYATFVTPSWNTLCWISAKMNGQFTVNFSNPPPIPSTLYWTTIPGVS